MQDNAPSHITESGPEENKKPSLVKRWRLVWGTMLVILLIAASVGGYFIWLELSYQTDEADLVVSQALDHLNSAHDEADKVIKCLEKIDGLTEAKSDGDRSVTRERVTQIQGEITQARASLQVVGNEISAYNANLDTADAFKLKDEYRSYLAMRHEGSDQMRAFIDRSTKSFTVLEQLANMHGTELDINARYDNFEFSLDPVTFLNQAQQLKADAVSIVNLENQLVENGVLDKGISETNIFYLGCTEKIVNISNAYSGEDFYAFENAMNDFDTSCSEAAWNENEARYFRLWDSGWYEFFDSAIDEARELNGSAQRNKRQTDDYYQYNV